MSREDIANVEPVSPGDFCAVLMAVQAFDLDFDDVDFEGVDGRWELAEGGAE